MTRGPLTIDLATARRIWLNAQRLDVRAPFGAGAAATAAAVAHLGYVQIDTINVVERSHHHILYTRIPEYRRADLQQAQAEDRTVFEYWTHALAYVPVADFRYFVPAMKAHRANATQWAARAPDAEVRRVLARIRRDGPVSIRDMDDKVLVEKAHPWASRKPSKAALQRAFYDGRLTIGARQGMVKSYELTERHFGWRGLPRGATAGQFAAYQIERAVRAQGLISAPSVMYPWLRFSAEAEAELARRVRRKALVEVRIEGSDVPHWAAPEVLETALPPLAPLVHILSPFDPLVIQRARLALFFNYEHVFEAYVPKTKRRFGYFTLPVLVGDDMVAALDLKADRAAGQLLIQAWHWLEAGRPRAHKRLIEEELGRFERFQLAPETTSGAREGRRSGRVS